MSIESTIFPPNQTSNEVRIPKNKDGVLDWDGPDAVDISMMAETLKHIREHGFVPPSFQSKEDLNTVPPSSIPESVVEDFKAQIGEWCRPGQPGEVLRDSRLCLLDGFLMYPPSMSAIHPFLNLKIFLRTTKKKVIERRGRRDGYATIEGWWVDPPGYVEDIVWPAYVREHAFMFRGSDAAAFAEEVVEGEYDAAVLEREKIWTMDDTRVMRGEDITAEEVLKWGVELVKEGIAAARKEETL